MMGLTATFICVVDKDIELRWKQQQNIAAEKN